MEVLAAPPPPPPPRPAPAPTPAPSVGLSPNPSPDEPRLALRPNPKPTDNEAPRVPVRSTLALGSTLVTEAVGTLKDSVSEVEGNGVVNPVKPERADDAAPPPASGA